MFPEYVEGYMQQQNDPKDNAKKSEVKVESGENIEIESGEITPISEGKETQNTGKQKGSMAKFPMWLTAILFALFASIMALPLLTLDFAQL